jgi:hypothetical protein
MRVAAVMKEGHARLELGRLAGRPLVRLRTTVRSASHHPSIGFGFGFGVGRPARAYVIPCAPSPGSKRWQT